MNHVAVVVPGIMGSVLKLGNEVIWPGSPGDLIGGHSKMRELLRPDLRAVDCIRHYFISEQYDSLIEDLETCGFSEGANTLVIAPYDWRKDNADSAVALADILDGIPGPPDTQISLIAHSMGGLVSRYYLESGSFDARPAFARVKQLITLGTPHRGAAVALPIILGKERRLFLNKDQVLQLSSDTRYPSAYQLLPHVGEPFAIDGAASSMFAPVDVYDSKIAMRLGLVPANLDAARRFHAVLKVVKPPKEVRYFFFSGTDHKTTVHVRLQERANGTLDPMKLERDDGGDGTVPTWSAFITGHERFFVGGEHGTLYKDRDLRRTLATLLGKEGMLADFPVGTVVTVRDRVVEPSDRTFVVVSFPGTAPDFDGVLTVERAKIDPTSGRAIAFDPPVSVLPLRYQGVGVTTLSFELQAPAIRGAYRVSLRDSVQSKPIAYDELIVQSGP